MDNRCPAIRLTEEFLRKKKMEFTPNEIQLMKNYRILQEENEKLAAALAVKNEALKWLTKPLCMCFAGCEECNPANGPDIEAAIMGRHR